MDEPTQSSAKSFRWYSTVESAEKLEFSVLAAVESVCAVTLSLWLAWYFQTYMYLVGAFVVAPLLLLRTEESVELGLRWFGGFLEGFSRVAERFAKLIGITDDQDAVTIFYSLINLIFIIPLLWFIVPFYSWLPITVICVFSGLLLFAQEKYQLSNKLEKLVGVEVVGGGGAIAILVAGVVVGGGVEGGVEVAVEIAGVVLGVLGVVVVAGVLGVEVVVVVGSLIIKFAATTFTCFQQLLLRRSGNCLHVIPLNWYRIVLATDMRHPPELLPGIESPKYQALTGEFSEFRFSKWLWKLTTQSDVFGKMFRVINGIIVFLPALFYRWSLKSSALFYLPFLWIIGTAKARQNFRESIDEQYVLWRYTLSGQLIVAYSWIIVIFAVLQIVLKIKFHDFSTQANYPFIELVMPFFVNFQWNVWDVTRFLSALLTLVVWFWIDKLSVLKKHGIEKDVTNEIDMIFYLKRLSELLAGYTLLCSIYILHSSVPWLQIFSEIFKEPQLFPIK